jgi:hypothetical protein
VEEIDNVAVKTKPGVESKLLGPLIHGQVKSSLRRSRSLGETLDSNSFIGQKVVALEHHAKGAMVEGRDCLITAIEKNAANKLISQALHTRESCRENGDFLSSKKSEGR